MTRTRPSKHDWLWKRLSWGPIEQKERFHFELVRPGEHRGYLHPFSTVHECRGCPDRRDVDPKARPTFCGRYQAPALIERRLRLVLRITPEKRRLRREPLAEWKARYSSGNGDFSFLNRALDTSGFRVAHLGYHLKTGHTLSVQNRPTGLA